MFELRNWFWHRSDYSSLTGSGLFKRQRHVHQRLSPFRSSYRYAGLCQRIPVARCCHCVELSR
jgi:hypothetical protein